MRKPAERAILKMIDSFGRNINYLRVSVTKRCNLNCSYCGVKNEKSKELSPEQIEKIVRIFVSYGITKVRLTGGEPLVRDDICEIIKRINKINGIEKIALTTNGIRLKEMAQSLKNAGLTAINISLDTTDKIKFKEITGYDGLAKVLEGLDECEKVGLNPIRINSVLIRGRNDDAAESLVDIARNRKIDVRFIELMPFSDDGDNKNLVISGRELLEKFPFLKPYENHKANGFEKSVAKYYFAEGFRGRIGMITPVSEKFCLNCNRVRLLSDGKVKPCLGCDLIFDLMPYIDNENLLRNEIERAILSKPMEHKFSCEYGTSHGMNTIGG